MPRRAMLATVILCAAILVAGSWWWKYHVSYWDQVVAEVNDPQYANKSRRLNTESLYARYQRDMSIKPEVQTLSTIIAERGEPASDVVIRHVATSTSLKEVANAIIIFVEMKRLRTFDICDDEPKLRILVDRADSVRLNQSFGPFGSVQAICGASPTPTVRP